MAQALTGTFGQFIIEIGDGATPTEEFTPICGLTSKGINFSAETVTSEVPDCDDEDLPSWMEKDVKAVGASISGSGMWAKQSHETMMQWILNGTKKNVKVRYPATAGDVGSLTGPAVCTALGHAAEKGGRITCEISIEFSAKPVLADAA